MAAALAASARPRLGSVTGFATHATKPAEVRRRPGKGTGKVARFPRLLRGEAIHAGLLEVLSTSLDSPDTTAPVSARVTDSCWAEVNSSVAQPSS
jgi:hypothetical protein